MRSDAAGELDNVDGSPAVAGNGWLYLATGDAVKAFEHYPAGGRPVQLTLTSPSTVRNVHASGNRLVSLTGNVINIYNNAPQEPGALANVVSAGINECGPLGLAAPKAAFLAPTGHLIVADSGHHRVLIWNPERVPQGDGELPEPSVVVGQPDNLRCFANASDVEDVPAEPSKFGLKEPSAVWSDGDRLVVADAGNSRVLIWNRLPTQDFQPADHVIGQADFGGGLQNRGGAPSDVTLCSPRSVDVNDVGQLAVADTCNHRVLVWDAVPGAADVPANHVIGQASFDENAPPSGPTERSLRSPSGARFHGRNLVVVDSLHGRVLVFPANN